MTLGKIGTGCATLLFSSVVSAAPLFYDCVVDHHYALATDGQLSAVEDGEGIGSKFHVNRVTGDVAGKYLHTRNAPAVRIVNRGTAESPFIITADLKSHILVLEVNELVEGESKPFVSSAMEGTGFISGLCK